MSQPQEPILAGTLSTTFPVSDRKRCKTSPQIKSCRINCLTIPPSSSRTLFARSASGRRPSSRPCPTSKRCINRDRTRSGKSQNCKSPSAPNAEASGQRPSTACRSCVRKRGDAVSSASRRACARSTRSGPLWKGSRSWSRTENGTAHWKSASRLKRLTMLLRRARWRPRPPPREPSTGNTDRPSRMPPLPLDLSPLLALIVVQLRGVQSTSRNSARSLRSLPSWRSCEPRSPNRSRANS